MRLAVWGCVLTLLATSSAMAAENEDRPDEWKRKKHTGGGSSTEESWQKQSSEDRSVGRRERVRMEQERIPRRPKTGPGDNSGATR
jgi:hypothetical protein